MKRLLTILFLTFGIFLISGCSLTEQKPADNSAMNEKITALQQQISGFSSQIETFKSENEQLKKESEELKKENDALKINNNSESETSVIDLQNEELKKEVEKYKQALLQEKLKNTVSKNQDQQVNQPQEIIYNNSKYKFSLKLPIIWKGYKVAEPGNGGTICFYIPSSGSQPFCIFQLYLLSENESLPSGLKLIGQTNSWKVTSDKDNTSCVQFNNFQCERAKEVPEILKTFEVIQ